METMRLDVYSEECNYAVIRADGRVFPGCLIQGDSLAILCRTAKRVADSVRTIPSADPEFLFDVEDLTNALIDRLLHYQSVLREHGIDLPFVSPFTECDRVQLVPKTSDD